MNAQIVKLFVAFLALYGLLLAFTSYWAIIDAENLKEHTANRRPLLEQQRIERGTIRTIDGTVVARSQPAGGARDRIYVREYPEGELFGHPIGYSFLERGQIGFELTHNDELVGNKPEFLSIVDQLLGHSQEGSEVVTSINAEAQRVAADALAGERGSVVALDPRTGEVLVMVSSPSYDPNRVVEDFAALNRAEDSPLFNRATQSGYPVGSTMKVVAAAAALDSGQFEPDSTVNGDNDIPISGVPLRNFGGRSFGQVDLTMALTNSVNTAWAQVAEELGTGTIFDYMGRFGFGSPPPLDYPRRQLATSGVFEGDRLLGSGANVDIGRVAIGQERLRVTPLQMAMVAAGIANDGVLMEPRLWSRVVDPDGRVRDLSPARLNRVMRSSTAETLASMMTDVVNEGTGGAAALARTQVAGKTGTAERGGEINQAWFIGFAPADDPEVAIAVTVEETTGTGGDVAAPIAQRVMEVLLAGGDDG